ANFWQDVSRDLEKGRIYIPLDALASHGLSEVEIVERKFDARYAGLMKDLMARTRALFAAGMPLARRVDGALRVDIEMFSRGGLAILNAIETSGYNTLEHRPALTKWKQLRLLGRALGSRAFSGASAAPGEPHRRGRGGRGAGRGVEAASTGERGSSPAEAQTIATSYEECNRIARAAHSSFYLAFFGLPREKRNALFALYAFMRLVDNISDEPGDLESKRRELARWRGMLDNAIAGRTEGHAILP